MAEGIWVASVPLLDWRRMTGGGAVVRWCGGAVVRWCGGAVAWWCDGAVLLAIAVIKIHYMYRTHP